MTTKKTVSKIKDKSKNPEISLSVVSIIISTIFSIISIWISIEANSTSKEANYIAQNAQQISQEANEIALGRFQAYPYIDVTNNQTPDKIDLLSKSDLINSSFEIFVDNTGDVIIDQIAVEIIGLPGLFYSLEPTYEEFEFSKRSNTINVDLSQQLVPGGYVFMDLKSAVLGYITEAFTPPNEINSTYIISLNLIFAPRRFGDNLPVQTPGNASNDRNILTLRISSDVLKSEEIKNQNKDLILTRVYPGENP
jgi:hypothetical protein